MDLSKPFDSLSHEILLKKLKPLNSSDSAVECIQSFLTKRLQQVPVNGIVSEWIELKQGVLQRTVPGPLLCNLYFIELSNQTSENTHIIQYSDDCLLYSSDSESEVALNPSHKNLVLLESYFFLLIG